MSVDNPKIESDALIKERNYIAHELHDSLAQTLASVRYTIRNLDHAIQGGDECEIFEILEVLETNVEVANIELRHLITKFRAPLQEDRLIPAIQLAVDQFKMDVGINAVLQNKIGSIVFSSDKTVEIIRVVQEALSNIRKHAKASNVRVLFDQDENECTLLIEDDGIGFEHERDGSVGDLKFGLNIMQERAVRIGGILEIDSTWDEGTCIRFIFPNSK